MTRDELIVVIEDRLKNSSEYSTNVNWGEMLAYLKGGCDFSIEDKDHSWSVEVMHAAFATFDGDPSYVRFDTYYIPKGKKQIGQPRTDIKTDYTRLELLDIASKAMSVPEKLWGNRDTPAAVGQAGRCYAELLMGNNFIIRNDTTDNCSTNERTIWVDIGDQMYYLPTPERLNKTNGKDWY